MISSTLILDRLDDITECPVCTESYTDPRSLPCTHTYCLKCIEAWGGGRKPGESILCPECRQYFVVPPNGLRSLPKNCVMLKVLELKTTCAQHVVRHGSGGSISCELCRLDADDDDRMDAVAATRYCEQCQLNLCGRCADEHGRTRATSRHVLVVLSDQQAALHEIRIGRARATRRAGTSTAGQPVAVDPARSSPQPQRPAAAAGSARDRYQGCNLYVKYLEPDVDDAMLRALFEPYGRITSLRVMTNADGSSRGFGFVCFSSPEQASRAMAEMNGRIVLSKALHVSLARRKDERKDTSSNTIGSLVTTAMVPTDAADHPTGNTATSTEPQQRLSETALLRASARSEDVARHHSSMPSEGDERQRPAASTPAAVPPSEDWKQALGERLYPLVAELCPSIAGKVTGMLLELDSDEVLSMLGSADVLREKVQEAVTVLNHYRYMAQRV